MSLKQLAPQELVGLISVICSIAYAYGHAGFLWICALTGRKKLMIRPWEKMIMALSSILSICFIYSLLVEPYWLEVTHISIKSPKLPSSVGKVRIVLLSDLHCDAVERLEPSLPNIVKKENPDLIVFTGDALNETNGLPVFKKCLKNLAKIAPTYIVEGNHDTRDFPRLNLVSGTGAVLLRCNAADVSIRDATLHLVGTSVDFEKNTLKYLQDLNPKLYNIFLYHFPAEITAIRLFPVDLMLAGHTHGGQVCLPFYGAIVTHSLTSKTFEKGLYRVDNTWLYVNRGIGMDGGLSPRIRFLARPELTVIDLIPDQKAPGAYAEAYNNRCNQQLIETPWSSYSSMIVPNDKQSHNRNNKENKK